MRYLRYLIAVLMGGFSMLAAAATFTNAGVARAEEPQGVQLRQESARAQGFFHSYRSHRGGGLRGGK